MKLSPFIFGIVLILIGLGYRRYISNNEDDFYTPIGVLYGYSMIFICDGVLMILVSLTMEMDKILS